MYVSGGAHASAGELARLLLLSRVLLFLDLARRIEMDDIESFKTQDIALSKDEVSNKLIIMKSKKGKVIYLFKKL